MFVAMEMHLINPMKKSTVIVLVVSQILRIVSCQVSFLTPDPSASPFTIWNIGSKGNQVKLSSIISFNANLKLNSLNTTTNTASVIILLADTNVVNTDNILVNIPWTITPGQYELQLYTLDGTLKCSTKIVLLPPSFSFTANFQTIGGNSVIITWDTLIADKYLDSPDFYAEFITQDRQYLQRIEIPQILSGSAIFNISRDISIGSIFTVMFKNVRNNDIVLYSQTSYPVPLIILEPYYTTAWTVGNSVAVTWSTVDITASTVSVWLFSSSTSTAAISSVQLCFAAVATQGWCKYTLPTTLTAGKYRVTVDYSLSGTQSRSYSNEFQIYSQNTNTTTTTNNTNSSSNTTLIIGAVVGVVALLTIGGGIAYGMNRRRLAKQLKSLKTEMESKQPAAHLQKTVIIGPDGQIIDVPVDAYSPGLNVKLQPAISSSSINADLKRRPSAYQLGGLVISTDVKRQPSLNQIKIGPISPGTTAILSGDLEGAKQKAYYDALFGSSPPGTVPASPDATRLYNPINDEDLTDDLFATLTTGSIILGKYRIKGPTLKGGTAVIRLATDEKTDKRVAIKLTASHQEAINELRILKNLRSPFIVSLEDSYILPQLSSPLIVMEQLDKSLNDFVRSKQLEVQAIKLILSHIISGVEYLHAANLVHCDLKPANIMLSSADIQWKIIDFGNSKTALADDVNGLTPMYCPPEVARAVLDNRPIKAHPSIDLWQIGVVIYYMFTRNLPFEGTEEKEILRQLAEPGFTLDVGGISDNQAKNLLIKLFTEDPKKRMALDKLKKSAFLNSGLDTVQVEQAAGASASIYGEKLTSKLDSLISDVSQVKKIVAKAFAEIKATRRQIYEHQEYQCPRLLLILPRKNTGPEWNPKKWFTESYNLYLLCEHEDCVHFTEHAGYELTEPKDFVRKAAPILSLTLKIVDAALGVTMGDMVSIPPAVFDFLKSTEESPVCNLIPRRKEGAGTNERALETADFFRQINGQLSPVVQQEMDAHQGSDMSKLVGAALRELQVMLKEMDPKSNWGGLQAVSTSDGQIRYVCPKHANHYHLHHT